MKILNINFQNANDLQSFVQDNIKLINEKISEFSAKKYKDVIKFDKTDIRRFLKARFKEFISNPEAKRDLLDRFESVGYAKNKIKDIAVDKGLYHVDLEKFYQNTFFQELSSLNETELCRAVVNTILKEAKIEEKKNRYGKMQLAPIIRKVLYIALNNGFILNRDDAEEGIMTSNAGDSAQFLFLARAILAGYNCSNVDVRSSRYDAVIDKDGHLFRVQVKGISGSTLHFKDRDRGGVGIDHTNAHNKGKRITSSDCDIYVAVDKQIGICYIIPVSKIDEWNVDQKSLTDVSEYKENWQVIDDLVI